MRTTFAIMGLVLAALAGCGKDAPSAPVPAPVAAATDPDAAVAVQRFEHGRWPGMRNLAGRLEAQAYLRHDLSRDEAAQILWVLTSFPTFDQLFRERGLSATRVADRLRAMAEHTLLRASVPDAP